MYIHIFLINDRRLIDIFFSFSFFLFIYWGTVEDSQESEGDDERYSDKKDG